MPGVFSATFKSKPITISLKPGYALILPEIRQRLTAALCDEGPTTGNDFML